ncbi:hypothetical protein HYQ46_009426 [Verticillium longisporum]|nr:hypothetical protein HYQ46_009426 [Verticillium longisporum]
MPLLLPPPPPGQRLLAAARLQLVRCGPRRLVPGIPGLDALAPLGHAAQVTDMTRLPQHLAQLAKDLLRRVHGPDDVEVLVRGDDFAVDDAHVRLPALLEPSQQLAPVDEVVVAGDPEGKGRRALVVPRRCAAGLVELCADSVRRRTALGPAGVAGAETVRTCALVVVLALLGLDGLLGGEDALVVGEAVATEPPAHRLGADIDGGELEHAVAQVALPAFVGPVEEKRKDLVAEPAVEARRQQAMHGHHEGDEGAEAKDDAEESRRDDAHKLEVGLADERACVRRRREGAENGEAVTEVGALLLGQGHERLRGALRGWEVEDAHLADVPAEMARVRVRQDRVLRAEAAAVVAEPDVVAGLAEVKGERVLVVDAVGAGALQEAVHQENGKLGRATGQ